MKKSTITAVMITYNAERFIRGSLESIKDLADEIIVVDRFSTDQTIKIARKYTDKIIQSKLDASERMNIGIDKATSDWILIIGATERIPEALKKEILDAVKNNGYVGYHIPRNNYVYCSFMKEKVGPIWLFRKGTWRYACIGGHESIHLKGKVGYLKNFKIHWASLSIEAGIDKINKYTSRDAKAVFAGNPNAFWWRRPVYRVNLFNLFYRTLAGFYAYYFVGKYYRYGMHGFIESVLGAFYYFVEMAKLWELRYREKHNIKDEVTFSDFDQSYKNNNIKIRDS
jgi:glycosyltransferase involved in cell wall biosynthesis